MTTTINDVLDFTPGSGGGEASDYVDDGYYRLALTEISMPFQEPAFGAKPDPLTKTYSQEDMTTKVRFYFAVVGEPKADGSALIWELAENEVAAKVNTKVRADSNGPKSTKYKIASALLGTDLATYVQDNGPIKATDLLNLQCWAKIENKTGTKDPSKEYTNITDFFIELPKIALPKAARGGKHPF